MFCSVHGLRDLVWLPIEQYRKDGRIVRGFQRGTASFGTSTAMAALELTNRMVRTVQVNCCPTHFMKSNQEIYQCIVSVFVSSDSSWDSLWHGVSSSRREGHKEGKTLFPLWPGSSACWPERRCSQSVHCGERGKQLNRSSIVFTLLK